MDLCGFGTLLYLITIVSHFLTTCNGLENSAKTRVSPSTKARQSAIGMVLPAQTLSLLQVLRPAYDPSLLTSRPLGPLWCRGPQRYAPTGPWRLLASAGSQH